MFSEEYVAIITYKIVRIFQSINFSCSLVHVYYWLTRIYVTLWNLDAILYWLKKRSSLLPSGTDWSNSKNVSLYDLGKFLLFVNVSAYPCCSTHHRTSLPCLSKIKIAIVYQILFYIYKIHWTYVLYIDNLWFSWIMCSVPPGFGLSHVPGPLACLRRCLKRWVLQMRQQVTADVWHDEDVARWRCDTIKMWHDIDPNRTKTLSVEQKPISIAVFCRQWWRHHENGIFSSEILNDIQSIIC